MYLQKIISREKIIYSLLPQIFGLRSIVFFTSILISSLCFGQTKYSLDSCVRYALENNYTVKQALLDMEASKVQSHTSKMSVLPNVSASAGQSVDFGRGTTATGLIENNSQATTTLGIGVNLPLFQGFRIYNQHQSDKFSLQAAVQDLNKIKENIEISVTAYYLQVLLCREILRAAERQAEMSQMQVQRIAELVNAEKIPRAELYAVESTLAADELTVTEAKNSLRLALLDLSQLMNVKNASAFDIEDYPNDDLKNDLPAFAAPIEDIIRNGLQKRPSIEAATYRIAKSKSDIQIAKSFYYPSLHLSASYGTGYYHAFQGNPSGTNISFGTQLSNNSQERLSLSLNIPIFNAFAASDGVKQATIALKLQEINLEEAKNNLIKEIEQAYTAALASWDKYAAAQKAAESAAVSFAYETVKYDAGTSSNYEYTDAKTKHQAALSQLIQAKYDYLFRVKILECYAR
ncbi:MAG: TolC family protein [Lentimicrobiaceae bacterium]|nr:TolC family protein [Lentimicrobiaceae bacterium]